jgi:hypothetical protein
MFTTNLTLSLKPNAAQEFTRIVENEITPLLGKQKGFRDEISSVASERSEASMVVFFDSKADAETYNRTGYTEVLKTLAKVSDGIAKQEICEVVSSTFNKIGAAHGG